MEEAYDRKETLADEEMKDRLMHKEILAYLVSQFVDDFKKMHWREVLPFLEDPHGGDIRRGDRESTVKGHGGVRYDILVRLTSPKRKDKKIGVVLNVEGQNEINSYEAMKKRMLYYPCRLINEQKGDIFTNDHYRDLAEVVSVWLFLRPAKRDQGLVVEWSMTSRKLTSLEGTSPTWEDSLRGLKVVAVCVPDLKHVQSHTVAGMLGVCLDALLPTGERNEMLKKDWDVDLPSSAKEDSSMFEGAGRSLWKEGWQKGFQEGFIIGFREGFREGLQKGSEKASLETIRNISAQLNLSSAQVMDILRIPPKERRRLQAQLDQTESKRNGCSDSASCMKEVPHMFEDASRALWQEGRQTGRLEGRVEAFLESIRNLSAHFNLSSAQAMDVLRISPKERRRIQAKFGHPETKGKG